MKIKESLKVAYEGAMHEIHIFLMPLNPEE